MELTIKELKEMEAGKIFSTGTGTYPELVDAEIRWVAKRGDGFHDWTIYYCFVEWSSGRIAVEGDKCFTESVIKRLVPCDYEAYKLYRF